MSEASFRFSKEILFRLGEELNPGPDQSILELAKNAYDADALNCTIELIDTDAPGGTIRISDDGIGMDDDVIREGWLVLGRSLKSQDQRTKLGRIPAGTKGLGRLAALRMGEVVVLASRPRKEPGQEYRIRIDWSAYDGAELVDEVELTIDKHAAPKGSKSGTDIIIEKVRRRIGRVEVKHLARALLLLADPFADTPKGFNPVLKAPEFADLENLVRIRYFRDAEYHLVSSVDENGKARASVFDFRGKKLFSANHEELTRQGDSHPYHCPPAKFDLWAFILSPDIFSTRSSTLGEVRKWLGTFAGVHLYQNDLRVTPYGNPGNDWLEMNLSRVRSPEERPSTNNSIGRLSVLDTSVVLIQKTDRSGFVESEAFLELRQFAVDALEWMARRRMEVAQKRRIEERVAAPRRALRAKESVEQAIDSVPKATKETLQHAFVRYERTRDKEIRDLRKEVQLYRTLSTAGITSATFAHEAAGNPIKVIDQSAKTIQRRGRKELDGRYASILGDPVDLIMRSTDALRVLANVTLDLLDHEKRRLGRVDLHQVIRRTVKTFRPFLDNRKITVIEEFAPGEPYLRGSEAAIESIITNLLNNSVIWLEAARVDERKMVIRTEITERLLIMRFLDNGQGIEGIEKRDIWLPGETTRPHGTGLGLTIVRDAIKDLGGNVDVIEHGELGGAEFIMEIPILGA